MGNWDPRLALVDWLMDHGINPMWPITVIVGYFLILELRDIGRWAEFDREERRRKKTVFWACAAWAFAVIVLLTHEPK